MGYDKIFVMNDFPNYEEYQKMEKYGGFGVYVFNYMKENKKRDIDYSLLDTMQRSEDDIRDNLYKFIEQNYEKKEDKEQQEQEICLGKFEEYRKRIGQKKEIYQLINKNMEDDDQNQKEQKQQLLEYIDSEQQYREYNQKVETVKLIEDEEKLKEKIEEKTRDRNVGKYCGEVDGLDGLIGEMLYQVQMEQHQQQSMNVKQFMNRVGDIQMQFINIEKKLFNDFISNNEVDSSKVESISKQFMSKTWTKYEMIKQLQIFKDQFKLLKDNDQNWNKNQA